MEQGGVGGVDWIGMAAVSDKCKQGNVLLIVVITVHFVKFKDFVNKCTLY
jgi:hypothetical protein